MAGEWSKKIGEEGERIALKLMNIIGWGNLQIGLDIPCLDNDNHNREKDHGLDGLFTYKSPLHDQLLRHVCISVKNHADEYPKGLNSQFKKNITQLDATISCFNRSELRSNINQQWNNSSIKESDTVGVLLWINGDRSEKADHDLIERFKNVSIPSNAELNHPIMLIDQNRAEFIFETHNYAKSLYPEHQITFSYHKTGNNNLDDQRNSDGKKLPWDLFSSGVIVYRAVRSKENQNDKNLIIASIEKFSDESFKRLLSFANYYSDNLSNKVFICFPDYIDIKHRNDVNSIKSSFDNDDFTNSVTVSNYKPDLRN